MKKTILTIILLSVFIIISCEEPQEKDEVVSIITINSPINGYEFIYNGESLEINVSVTNLSNIYAAYIYVDGNLCGTLEGPPFAGTGVLTFLLGGDSKGLKPFKGSIDDVRIYDRALSAEEVKALYEFEKAK